MKISHFRTLLHQLNAGAPPICTTRAGAGGRFELLFPYTTYLVDASATHFSIRRKVAGSGEEILVDLRGPVVTDQNILEALRMTLRAYFAYELKLFAAVKPAPRLPRSVEEAKDRVPEAFSGRWGKGRTTNLLYRGFLLTMTKSKSSQGFPLTSHSAHGFHRGCTDLYYVADGGSMADLKAKVDHLLLEAPDFLAASLKEIDETPPAYLAIKHKL